MLLLSMSQFCGVSLLQAQQESFDMATFNRPADSSAFKWSKTQEGNIFSYTAVNTKDNSWCRINIVKSTSSKGSIEKDFSSEWQELILKNYTLTGSTTLNPVQQSGDWKTKSGASAFSYNNNNAMALLSTTSGNDRCMSIVATTNSTSYISRIETFLASVVLKKPETASTLTIVTGNTDRPLTGTWVISASDQSSWRVKNGVMSTIWRQYTLNTNGTYVFYSKLFDPMMDKMFLGKESGTFTLSDNHILINPHQSVLESWTRKNGNEWAKKISSQKIAIEKVTYQFSMSFNPVFQEWQLTLKNDKLTKRDGPYSSNAAGWIYNAATDKTRIILPVQ